MWLTGAWEDSHFKENATYVHMLEGWSVIFHVTNEGEEPLQMTLDYCVSLEGIQISVPPMMIVGERLRAEAQFIPVNSFYEDVTWSTSNPDLLTVDDYGTVTALAAGEATLTATSHSGKTATATVRIVQPVELSLGQTATVDGQGLAYFYFRAPEDGDYCFLIDSPDASTELRPSGLVTYLHQGKNALYAGLRGGKSLGVIVDNLGEAPVTAQFSSCVPMESLTIDCFESVMKVGDTGMLTAAFSPRNSAWEELTWESSNPEVLKLSEDGTFEFLRTGSTVVTVTTASGKTDSVAIDTYHIGECGQGVIWEMDLGGTLYIQGQGSMESFTAENPAPWSVYKDEIETVFVWPGVTSIGSRAFEGCKQLSMVSVGTDVAAIGDRAFYDCTALSEVYFWGKGFAAKNVFLTAYYPEGDSTWTSTIRSGFGKKVTWVVWYESPALMTTSLTMNSYLESGVEIDLRERHGNRIQSISLYDYNTSTKKYEDTLSERFEMDGTTLYSVSSLANGSYKLCMKVACGNGETYTYYLTVKVANALPSVTVKQEGKFNLFYLDSEAKITVAAPGQTILGYALEGTEDFVLDEDKLVYSDSFKEAPKAKPDTSAAITVWLKGYRVPVTKTITLNAGTTAPKLALNPASTTFNTKLGDVSGALVQVLDKTTGQVIPMTADMEVRCNDSFVTVDTADECILLSLNGTKGGTATIYVRDIWNWAQPIKLSHKVSVSTKLPTLKLAASSVTLNSKLIAEQFKAIPLSFSQGNFSLDILDEVIITSTAKKGSAAAAEAEKLSVSYDGGMVYVDLLDNTIKPGTYSYSYKGKLSDDTAITGGTLKVVVTNALPKVKLSASSVKLNTVLAGEEKALLKATVADQAFTLLGFAEGYQWLTMEEGMVQVRLPEDAQVGKTKYTLTPVLRYAVDGQEVEAAPITLELQVYENEKISVTLSAKGKLDTQKPESAIEYTVSKVTNALGTVESVELTGQDADKFQVELDTTGAKPVIRLTMAEGQTYATKANYKVQFVVTVCGKEITLSPVSVKVGQTTAKVKAAPATVSMLLSQSSLSASTQLTLSLGEIKDITVGTKTTKALLEALGEEGLTVEIDGSTAQVTLTLENAGKVAAGKTYTLYLDVTPTNSAEDVKPITVKITVKITK